MSRDNANITRTDDVRPLAGSLYRSCTLLRALLDRVGADPDTWEDQDVKVLHGLAMTLVASAQYLDGKIEQIQQAEQAAQQMTDQCQSDTTPPRR